MMKGAGYEMDWIAVGIATVSAIGALTAAIYTAITAREQQKTRRDDKFPCVVVRSIKTEQKRHFLALANVGRGPAFVTMFMTKGLSELGSHSGLKFAKDGNHTHEMDRVIGPGEANLDFLSWFAYGNPDDLRSKEVSIGIEYKDIGGRVFRSGIINGKPVWDPPLDFLCGDKEEAEGVRELREFLAK